MDASAVPQSVLFSKKLSDSALQVVSSSQQVWMGLMQEYTTLEEVLWDIGGWWKIRPKVRKSSDDTTNPYSGLWRQRYLQFSWWLEQKWLAIWQWWECETQPSQKLSYRLPYSFRLCIFRAERR